MTRPFGVKGGRKRKHAEPKYDAHDEEEEEETQPKKTVVEVEHNQEEEEQQQTPEGDELSGIPIAPSANNTNKPNVIFILEKASLEVAKVGKVLLVITFNHCFFFFLSFFLITYVHSADISALKLRRPCQFPPQK